MSQDPFLNSISRDETQFLKQTRARRQKEDEKIKELDDLIKSLMTFSCFFCEGKGHFCDTCPLIPKLNRLIEKDYRHLKETFKSFLYKLIEKRKEWEEAEVEKKELDLEEEFNLEEEEKPKKKRKLI